jgi:hypothetical protein
MAVSMQQVVDREEIRDLLNRWALAVDLPDMDLFEACHTHDALIDFKEIGYQGSTARGHREFLEKSRPFFRNMHHVLSNTSFLELNEHSAKTRTMVTAATTMLDETVFFLGGWYHDTLKKTAQGWRIAARRAERTYVHNFPGSFSPQQSPANEARG